MTDFSFVQITDHHLLETEDQLREGFSPGYALRMVMKHIAENVAEKADFIISTGDLVEPETDATYQCAVRLLGIRSSAALPGPQRVNVAGLQDYPMYFLPGNHDDRALMTHYLFPASNAPDLYNLTFVHKGVQFIFMDWGPESKACFLPETRAFLEKQLKALEDKSWKAVEAETEDGVRCTTGQGGPCPAGPPGKLKLVLPSEADLKARDAALNDIVLKSWAKRCGEACAAKWTDTVGKKYGLTAKAD